jgi:hypothetical protein
MILELRPLTSRERRRLKPYARYRPGGLDDFLVNWLIGGGLVTLGLVLIASKIAFTAPYLVNIAIVSAGVAAVVAFHRARKRRQPVNPFRLKVEEDLNVGLAEVCTFEASEAIAVEEFEDEGTGLFLRVGPEQVLFLVGQYLDGMLAERQFPSTAFQLVRSPKAKLPLDLVPTGNYFAPLGTKSPFTTAEFDEGLVPTEGDLLEIDFDSLKPGMRKAE